MNRGSPPTALARSLRALSRISTGALVAGMAGDVAELLEKGPRLRVSLLADGAHEMWNLLEKEFDETLLGVEIHRLVDLWHLLEKLGKAAKMVHGETAADAVVTRWRMALLNRSTAAREIVGELWKSGCRHVRVDGTRPVHEAITYLINHRERMDYAAARRQGRPVGSGNVEATCKTLVEVRMKRAGSRWKERSGDLVLQLRALAQSDRWDHALALTLAPLRKSVRRAA